MDRSMKLMRSLTLSLLLVVLISCSPKEPPISVNKSIGQEQAGFSESNMGRQRFMTPRVAQYFLIQVTSKNDSVTIKNIKTNRGNCSDTNYQDMKMAFGQTFNVKTYCNPVQVDVTTEQGNFTFNWSE
jgi:hypothetical protein